MKQDLTVQGWLGKACAGVVLGFALALGASGLFRELLGIEEAFFSTRGQVSMWLMAPVWAMALSLCFLFRTAVRAWLWMAVANLVVWGVIALCGGLAA